MERTYKLNVSSDTTNIDVQSVNADEVARIAQLAGIIEPHTPSEAVTSAPVGAPVDPELSVGQPVMAEPTDYSHDADVMHGLNDLRKNAGLPAKDSVPMADQTSDIGEGWTHPLVKDKINYQKRYDTAEKKLEAFKTVIKQLGPELLHKKMVKDGCENMDPIEYLARSKAWGHGYGRLSPHYWNEIKHLVNDESDAMVGEDNNSIMRGDDFEYDQDMDENVNLDEDVAEYDYGRRKLKDEGEEIDEPDLIWQAVENPQRIKGSPGDNGLIQELHSHLITQYEQYLAEADRENETGVMSPLSDPTKPSFDKDPLSDQEPVDDGSHSPMSTIVRQHAFK